MEPGTPFPGYPALSRSNRNLLSSKYAFTLVQAFILIALVAYTLKPGYATIGSSLGDDRQSGINLLLAYLQENANVITAAILLAICAGLCISAGSGGGGLYVPLLIAMLGKEVHTATSISQVLIFGASMAGVAYDLFQRHPERQRPLVDFSVILFLAPIMMAGALVGSTISGTLPPSLVMLMLVIACSLAAYKSLRKGFRLWATEKAMDLDVMDTMEPIDPIAIMTCNRIQCGLKGNDTIESNSSLPKLVIRPESSNPAFPLHDHVIPLVPNKKRGGNVEDIENPRIPAGMPVIVQTPPQGDNTGKPPSASDMIYYKKLRDLRKDSSKPFEVMGIHRISFWNPKCNCVFSTFRDQDFIQVFQFLSKKELFSVRSVCLRWHFLSHAKALQGRFGNLKRTVSYSVIWNPETPTQRSWHGAGGYSPLEALKEEEPLMLGPSQATLVEDVEPPLVCQIIEEEHQPKRPRISTPYKNRASESTPLKLVSGGLSQPLKSALYNGSSLPPNYSQNNNKKAASASFKRPGAATATGSSSFSAKKSNTNNKAANQKSALFLNSSSTAETAAKQTHTIIPTNNDKNYNSLNHDTNRLLGSDVDVVVPTGGKTSSLLSKQQLMIKNAREKSREIIASEQSISPTQAIKLLCIWLITFALIVVRGGKGTKSILNVEYCGEVYWAVTSLSILLLIGVAFLAGKDLWAMHNLKMACHYPFAKGDPHWTGRYLRRMAAITFATGIAAGVLGVGGGMFLSPVLFEMGMLPLIVAAISTTCILLSSSVLTVLIIVQGTVAFSECGVYFLGTVCGAFVGKFFVRKIVARYRSSAIIPILLGGVIIASMLVATQQNAIKFIRQLEDGTIQGFKGVCQLADK